MRCRKTNSNALAGNKQLALLGVLMHAADRARHAACCEELIALSASGSIQRGWIVGERCKKQNHGRLRLFSRLISLRLQVELSAEIHSAPWSRMQLLAGVIIASLLGSFAHGNPWPHHGKTC